MTNGDNREPSDIFSTRGVLKAIAPMSEIPETKEERQRRLIIRTVSAVIAAIVIITAIIITVGIVYRSNVESAAQQVGDDGREASVAEFLDQVDGDDDDDVSALRARILAAQVLENGTGELDAVTAQLEPLLAEEPPNENAVVAQVYTALARFDTATAQHAASRLVVTGTYAAEIARARALSAVALANLEAAEAEAALALAQRPEAPRHVALAARIQAARGDADGALEKLAGVPDANGSPLVRVARARILLEAHRHDEAAAEAEAVLGELSATATPAETSWAHVVVGRIAAAEGRYPDAVEAIEASSDGQPIADVEHALVAAEALLAAGKADEAAAHLERIPAAIPLLRGRRNQANAELALVREQPRPALQVLGSAPDDARTALLRGRAEAALGRPGARENLERAASDPGTQLDATARLAWLDLGAGRAAPALERLTPLLEDHPHHPRLVVPAVRAKLASDDAAGALALVEPALERHPNDAALLAAKGRAKLALGDAEAALTALRASIERWDDDPDVHVDRGTAALRMRELDEAKEAFDKALELDDDSRPALVGALETAIEAGDQDGAEEAIEAIDQASLEGEDINRLRARYFVLVGAGQRGFRSVRVMSWRQGDDVVIQVALGALFRQAEEFRAASKAYDAALELDDDYPEALLGSVFTTIMQGITVNVSSGLAAARAAGEAQNRAPPFFALVTAAEARFLLMQGQSSEAQAKAREAIGLDDQCSAAHMVLADAARGSASIEHLRQAVDGRAAPPEAMARLVLAPTAPDDACDLAWRYLAASPSGRFATRVRNTIRRCPRPD